VLKNDSGLLLIECREGYETLLNGTPLKGQGHAFPGDRIRIGNMTEFAVDAPGEEGETLLDDSEVVQADAMARIAVERGDRLPSMIAGRYKVERFLGKGGMGMVVAAHDQQEDRPCAVKLLSMKIASAAIVKRFEREGAVGSKLGDHPGIVSVFDAGVDPETQEPYLAMDLVDGGPLTGNVPEEGMPLEEAVERMIELARIVGYAHERGVVHRDLKPDNVLLTHDGALRLTDFGLARELADLDRLTKTGVSMGTPLYMAPEQIVNSKQANMPADVYALGAMFYLFLTGKPPHQAERAHELFKLVLSGKVDPPSTHREGIDVELDRITAKALSRYALDRYPHAIAFARDLRAWLDAR
jgi:serine/threonine protein kinase